MELGEVSRCCKPLRFAQREKVFGGRALALIAYYSLTGSPPGS